MKLGTGVYDIIWLCNDKYVPQTLYHICPKGLSMSVMGTGADIIHPLPGNHGDARWHWSILITLQLYLLPDTFLEVVGRRVRG